MERITQSKIDEVYVYFINLSNVDQAPEGKWNAKEVIGHLIDSGINNLYRYQRMIINNETQLADYSQDELVKWQDYGHWDHMQLSNTWKTVNELILNFISPIPDNDLSMKVRIGSELITLEGMLLDYVQHIDHHLKQIKALQ